MSDEPKNTEDPEDQAPLDQLDDVPEVKGYSTPPAEDETEPDEEQS